MLFNIHSIIIKHILYFTFNHFGGADAEQLVVTSESLRLLASKTAVFVDQDRYNNWTMFAVEEGVFQFEIGAHRGEAFFGDIVVCPPGLVFHRKTVEPLTFHFVQFTWDVEPTKEQAEQMTGKITFIDTERLASTYRYIRSLNLTAGQEQSGNRIRHLLEDIWWLYGQESGKADRNRRGSGRSDAICPTMAAGARL